MANYINSCQNIREYFVNIVTNGIRLGKKCFYTIPTFFILLFIIHYSLTTTVFAESAPIITLTSPTGDQSCDVNILFTLTDTVSDNLSIYCEYSTNGGTNWARATVSGTTYYTNCLTVSSTITWKSHLDLINSSTYTVRFRITPADSQILGTPVSTTDFGIDNRHNPVLTITGIADNLDVPSGEITIRYNSTDPDGSYVQTTNWQYSRDNLNWYDIPSTAIGNNSYKPIGNSTISWNTRDGTNNLNLVEDDTVWFRMKLTDGLFYSGYSSTGPFVIDNYDKPVLTLTPVTNKITTPSLTIVYNITAAADENITLTCEYSKGGTVWSLATVSGSTYNITSDDFNNSLIWHCGTDISLGTDRSDICFRITPYGRAFGLPIILTSLHIDYNIPPTINVSDIYTIVGDTISFNYIISDPENDLISIQFNYSIDNGSTWKRTDNVTGTTVNISSSQYSGTIVWCSNFDVSNINTVNAKFMITPYDNDYGTSDTTLNFQLSNVIEAPVLTIDKIEPTKSGVFINYTARDPDYGDILYTTSWQFSSDNINWSSIDSSAISNNSTKPSGPSYIIWYSTIGTANLAGSYDDTLWFKMCVRDNNLLASNYSSTSPFVIDNTPVPSANVTNITTEQSGNIDVVFDISNPKGLTVLLKCYYTIDSGITWTTATVSGLAAEISGTSYSSRFT